ncbi:MAG: hypothetical protein Q9225_004058, partial [Loekoesia sp. 1 TL-2023]
MSEYEKLTVAKLRDELTRRGLPKTGLKAILIQRLVEADETSGQTDPAVSEPESKPAESNELEGTPSLPAEQPKQQNESSSALVQEEKRRTTTPPEPPPKGRSTSPKVERNHAPTTEPEATGTEANGPNEGDSKILSQPDAADVPLESQRTNQNTPTAAPSSDVVQAKREVDSGAVTAIDSEKRAQDGDEAAGSRQDSLNSEEVLEDMKKRKRRSTTPPPSAESVQKKARIDDARPAVKLPEDTCMEDANTTPAIDTPSGDLPHADKRTGPQDIAVKDGPAVEEAEANGKVEDPLDQTHTEPSTGKASEAVDKPAEEPETDTGPKTPETKATEVQAGSSVAPTQSPAKTSTPDARFRNILPTSSRRDSSPTQPTSKGVPEDRIVSPALHPATTALYIRNILRPLHVENLKDHLINLATPSDQSPDSSIIADFFLDSIRTHCLVRFSTVAAASRVRTGLHDRVWPDEKNRKPLWVDFVPEEKLPKWFEVENNSSGRGQVAKRWEVVYENEEDGVKAYLQEAGSNSGVGGALNKNSQAPSRNEGGSMPAAVRGAPSGPRINNNNNKDREQILNGPPPPSSDRAR